jgi:hypothetical protein
MMVVNIENQQLTTGILIVVLGGGGRGVSICEVSWRLGLLSFLCGSVVVG